ncbi:E3 ubiquitin-protein ligase rad18 [Ascochyta clinopodiicola]|nr:E3 ubiquitin-protein ligase rad18 [Ascochyta clinopodiicola]
MKEGALRKKLQELGIPNWGSKDLMKRRHIEWLNIHNSNCDADDSVRKTKRQLVRELEEWENTQGGRAEAKESKVMRKDFDGNGYAKSHKSDFDDLIAQARKQRAAPKPNDMRETNGEAGDKSSTGTPHTDPEPEVEMQMPDAPVGTEQQPHQPTHRNGIETQGLDINHGSHLRTPQISAQSTNQTVSNLTQQSEESTTTPHEEVTLGIHNPLGNSTRKVPMFTVPEDPVKELNTVADMSATDPTVRKDSPQSSKERFGKPIVQENGLAKPQYINRTTSVPIKSGRSYSRIPRRSNSSNSTVTGSGLSTAQKTAERRQQDRADPINDRDEEYLRATATSADVVTNKERAKSPTIARVLSPMRERRTPVLVNAPDVRWRLDPELRQVPSLNSVLSSSTTSASETSTIRLNPIPSQNVALPSSVASSLLTVMAEESNPACTPLPPSPPPNSVTDATEYQETVEQPTPIEEHYFQRTHHLSPVTEVSSEFSLRSLGSSIVDLEVQDIATAERHSLNEVTKQSAHIVSSADPSQASLSNHQSRQGRLQERFGRDVMEHPADSLRSRGVSASPVMSDASQSRDRDISVADEDDGEKESEDYLWADQEMDEEGVWVGGKVGQDVGRKLGRWVGLEWV